MRRHVCTDCGYHYDSNRGDQENGIAAGTLFPELSEERVCPGCGAPKDAS